MAGIAGCAEASPRAEGSCCAAAGEPSVNAGLSAKALVAWFRDHARSLPWREGYDPYRVLVSEFMLQQTQMSTAVPYFTRWMERWPDLSALAGADESEVLKLWEGLGYYSRCRNLLKAARSMVEAGYRVPPPDAVKLRTYPGIGEYTAGAVASVAYDLPVPAIDGNAERVIARLCDIAAPAGSTPLRSHVAAFASDMLRTVSPRLLNQALMDLGALVCTPRGADCGACPLAVSCLARRYDVVNERPLPRVRPPVVREEAWGLVALFQDRLLLRRRPDRGVWASMWEVPWFPRTAAGFAADFRDWTGENGWSLKGDVRELGAVSFSFTVHRVRAWVVACDLDEPSLCPDDWRLASLPEADALSLPAPSRKFLSVFRGR